MLKLEPSHRILSVGSASPHFAQVESEYEGVTKEMYRGRKTAFTRINL